MKKGSFIMDEQLLGVPKSLFTGDNGYESSQFLLFICSGNELEPQGVNYRAIHFFKKHLNGKKGDQNFFEGVVHPEDYNLLLQHLSSSVSMAPEEEGEIIVRLLSPYGYWKKFQFRSRSYRGCKDGEEDYVLSLAKPVDPYKTSTRSFEETPFEMEKLHEENLNRYRVLVNSMDDGFSIIEMIFDLDQNPVDYLFVEINPAFERHVHLQNPLGKTIKELSPSHDIHWFETYGKVVISGKPVRFEKYADDMGTWFDIYAFPIGNRKSRKVAILCSDITDRKETEEDLRRTNETLESEVRRRTRELKDRNDLLQMVFDTVSEGIFIMEPVRNTYKEIIDFRYIQVNRKIRKYYDVQDIEGRTFLELNPHVVESGVLDVFIQAMTTGKSRDFDAILNKNGKNNWFRISTRRQKGLLVSSLENVTRKRKRGKELQENIRFKKQMIDMSPDIILILNLKDEKVRFMNRDFSANPKLSRKRIEGMPLVEILNLIHPQHKKRALEFHKTLVNASDRDVVDFEFQLQGKEGEWDYYNARAKVFMRTSSGEPMEYIVLLRNVEDQKKTQQALFDAEKLSIKGEMARTLAHELRNPLASIGMSADILDNSLEEPYKKVLGNYTNIIKRSTKTLNNLVTELLTSSNYSPPVLQKCCLGETIDEVLDQAKDRIFLGGITVIKTYEKPCFIHADRDRLKIALLNIIINASEAMQPNEGVLRVKIDHAENYFNLEISDNGCGMEKDQIKRLFETFYTNKVGGMGVGLSSIKNILEQHYASVDVESEPNKGTTFLFIFPCYEEQDTNSTSAVS